MKGLSKRIINQIIKITTMAEVMNQHQHQHSGEKYASNAKANAGLTTGKQ